jgi:hypothetical protein
MAGTPDEQKHETTTDAPAVTAGGANHVEQQTRPGVPGPPRPALPGPPLPSDASEDDAEYGDPSSSEEYEFLAAMDAEMAEEEYGHLIDDYGHLEPPATGEVLQGTVLSVTAKDVIVDIGYKMEGAVPIQQLTGADGACTVKRGDIINVAVEKGDHPEGYVVLSFDKANRLRSWDNLERAHREGLIVSGRVSGRTKGGLTVDVGATAFMPGSQVDVRPVHNLDAWVGQDPCQDSETQPPAREHCGFAQGSGRGRYGFAEERGA